MRSSQLRACALAAALLGGACTPAVGTGSTGGAASASGGSKRGTTTGRGATAGGASTSGGGSSGGSSTGGGDAALLANCLGGGNRLYLSEPQGGHLFAGQALIDQGAWTGKAFAVRSSDLGPDTVEVAVASADSSLGGVSLEFSSVALSQPLADQTYAGAGALNNGSPDAPAFAIAVSGRSCDKLTASFTIDALSLDGDGGLANFQATFEVGPCDSDSTVLQGCVAFSSEGPALVCAADGGNFPADAGDPGPLAPCLGLHNGLYLQGSAQAWFTATALETDGGFSVLAEPEFVEIDLSTGDPLLGGSARVVFDAQPLGVPLTPGTYANAVAPSAATPCQSGFDFGTGVSSCGQESATFSVDAIGFDDAGTLLRFLGTFAQESCDQSQGLVLGCVSYTADGG